MRTSESGQIVSWIFYKIRKELLKIPNIPEILILSSKTNNTYSFNFLLMIDAVCFLAEINCIYLSLSKILLIFLDTFNLDETCVYFCVAVSVCFIKWTSIIISKVAYFMLKTMYAYEYITILLRNKINCKE